MHTRIRRAIVAASAAVGLVSFHLRLRNGQAPASYRAPRSPFRDGKPDLNGIWQANNSANWDIQGHAARQGTRARARCRLQRACGSRCRRGR